MASNPYAHKMWSNMHKLKEKSLDILTNQVLNHPSYACIRGGNLFYLYHYQAAKEYPQIAGASHAEERERKRKVKRIALTKMLNILDSI